jgi:hypothetical protein
MVSPLHGPDIGHLSDALGKATVSSIPRSCAEREDRHEFLDLCVISPAARLPAMPTGARQLGLELGYTAPWTQARNFEQVASFHASRNPARNRPHGLPCGVSMTSGRTPGIVSVLSVIVPAAIPVSAVVVIVAFVTIWVILTMIVINVPQQGIIESAHARRRGDRYRSGLRPWRNSSTQETYYERDWQQNKAPHVGVPDWRDDK